MISEELNDLIIAALADGEVTEKERAVLRRRAEKEGMDVDEFDILLDSRIIQRKEMLARHQEWKANSQAFYSNDEDEEDEENGETKKKPLTPYQQLCERLQKIEDKHRGEKTKWYESISKGDQERIDCLRSFPIPKEREHLLEMIGAIFSQYKSYGSGADEQPFKKAYKAKFDECLAKVKAFYPDDTAFEEYTKKKGGLFGFFKK